MERVEDKIANVKSIGSLSVTEAMHRMRTFGFVVVEDYWSSAQAQHCAGEIDAAMADFPEQVQRVRDEDTAGDERIFGIERCSEMSRRFAQDEVLSQFASLYANVSLATHFCIGGRLRHQESITQNSGGGWHRDGHGGQLRR